MQPDPAHSREKLYSEPETWRHKRSLLTALALDEAHGHVRRDFAAWVRARLRERGS
jgi:hypothetical protein